MKGESTTGAPRSLAERAPKPGRTTQRYAPGRKTTESGSVSLGSVGVASVEHRSGSGELDVVVVGALHRRPGPVAGRPESGRGRRRRRRTCCGRRRGGRTRRSRRGRRLRPRRPSGRRAEYVGGRRRRGWPLRRRPGGRRRRPGLGLRRRGRGRRRRAWCRRRRLRLGRSRRGRSRRGRSRRGQEGGRHHPGRRGALAFRDEPGEVRPARGELEHRERDRRRADERQRRDERKPVALARRDRRRGCRRRRSRSGRLDRSGRGRCRCHGRRSDDTRRRRGDELPTPGLEPAHLALDPAEPRVESLPARRDQVDQDGEVVDPLAPLGIGLAPEVAHRFRQLAEHRAELYERGVGGEGREQVRLGCGDGERELAGIRRGRALGRLVGEVGEVARTLEHVVQGGEREPLHRACLLGRQVVEHVEHALLDRVAHRLARQHAHDPLDRDVRPLGDLHENRHSQRVRDRTPSLPRPRRPGFGQIYWFQIGSTRQC